MATIETRAQTVVCDAGPVIHLDELGCLDLLADFDRVLLPRAVWAEVKRHRPSALKRKGAVLQCIDLKSEVDPEVHALSLTFTLHAGEKEALRLARNERADLFFTDDTAARFAARALGLKVHGTLGILTRAIRRKQKSHNEVLTLLRHIPKKSTLFVTPSLLLEVIEQVKQEQ